MKRVNELLEGQNVREGEENDKEIRGKESYIEILEADLGFGREELFNLSKKMTEREEKIWELMLKLEGLGKKEEDKDKDVYIERLDMRLGNLLQKMTEKEKIIKGHETKLEGLEKMLGSTAVYSAGSGNTGVSSVPSASYVA